MDLLFMRLEGIDGEEPIGDSQKLIKIVSYSHALSMPSAPFRPSVGKEAMMRRSYCQHSLFTVVKGFDNTSPRLFEACANGVIFPHVVIYLCIQKKNLLTKDEEMTPMLSIVLSDAVMESFDYGYSDGWPIETVGFRYASIGWKTDWVDPETGEEAKLSPVGWEGTENAAEAVAIPSSVKWGGNSLL